MKLIPYKLKYIDKYTAIEDLKNRGYIIESDDGDIWREDIKGIIHVGNIPLTKGEYDNEGTVLIEPTYKEGWHVDVYSEREDLTFNAETTNPANPYHTLL